MTSPTLGSALCSPLGDAAYARLISRFPLLSHVPQGGVADILRMQQGFVNLLRLKLSSNARIVYPGPFYPLSSPLRARDVGPALESLPHLLPVVRRRQQMASRSEVLGDWTIGRQEALRMTRRLKPLHAIFSLACGAMRVLAAVVEVATLPMFHPRQDLALRRAVALELLRDD